jgi:CRISPR-associated protein Cmr3
MSLWLIVPRDPLIFRDGKPFTATPGERSKSLGFPFPATLAGAVRTLVGPEPINGYDKSRIEYLKGIAMRGPALVELTTDGQISNWYFPAPADALLVEEKDSQQVARHALAPLNQPNGAMTDLVALALIGPAAHVKDKPYGKAPMYWNWNTMQGWLEQTMDSAIDPESLGLAELTRENRTHVSIEPGTQASREGALFQTSGMEFVRAEMNAEARVKDAHSLALAVETDATLNEGADFLGGERRVVRWQKTQDFMLKCPEAVKQKIIAQKHCRLILATPAYFEKGYLPSRLEKDFNVKVKAAALSRYQTISGWDYENGTPKPTRRLVPAGSVYFLNLEGVADIEAFVNAVWFQAISDDEQSRLDGFGLALLGAWDGVMRNMEVKS